MKKSNEKFFIIIGALLILAGILIFPDDNLIGIIGLLFGSYNLFKGIRLARGIQPLLIRKQQERYKEEGKDLQEKIKASKNNKKDEK